MKLAEPHDLTSEPSPTSPSIEESPYAFRKLYAALFDNPDNLVGLDEALALVTPYLGIGLNGPQRPL